VEKYSLPEFMQEIVKNNLIKRELRKFVEYGI
jgi:hypothetical protein